MFIEAELSHEGSAAPVRPPDPRGSKPSGVAKVHGYNPGGPQPHHPQAPKGLCLSTICTQDVVDMQAHMHVALAGSKQQRPFFRLPLVLSYLRLL